MTTPNTPASNDFVRDMAGETVCGFRVVAYRETHPEHGSKFGHAYSEHWSTPNSRNPAVKVERLFTEDQLRAALAAAPASPEPLDKERRNNAELLASICQKARHGSASPVERDEALRDAATMLRDFARSVAPAASPEPASNEAPGRGGVEVYATAPTELRGEVIDITAGKAYRVLREDRALFEIHDDVGFRLTCAWEDCAHLYGDGWTRSERRA